MSMEEEAWRAFFKRKRTRRVKTISGGTDETNGDEPHHIQVLSNPQSQHQSNREISESIQSIKPRSSAVSRPQLVAIKSLRIAKNGQDLGDIVLPKVQIMLRNGQLSQEDYYFDVPSHSWLPLNACIDLSQ